MAQKRIRIGLMGGPGCAKSTTAADVFVNCKRNQISAYLIQEYAREEIDRGWIPQSISEQFRILHTQREREDIVPNETQVMITDSPTLLIYYYALWNCQDHICDSATLTALYKEFINDKKRYNYLIFLNRVFPYVKDGTRIQSEEEADQVTVHLKALLDMHKIPYLIMDGDEAAVEDIMDIINADLTEPAPYITASLGLVPTVYNGTSKKTVI